MDVRREMNARGLLVQESRGHALVQRIRNCSVDIAEISWKFLGMRVRRTRGATSVWSGIECGCG